MTTAAATPSGTSPGKAPGTAPAPQAERAGSPARPLRLVVGAVGMVLTAWLACNIFLAFAYYPQWFGSSSVVIGLLGVAILVGFDPAALAGGSLMAELALVGATASYAIGGVYARRTVRGLRPMIPAMFQVAFAFVMVTVLAFLFERPFEAPITAETRVPISPPTPPPAVGRSAGSASSGVRSSRRCCRGPCCSWREPSPRRSPPSRSGRSWA